MFGSILISDCFYTSKHFEDTYDIKLDIEEKTFNVIGSFIINFPVNPIYIKDTKLYMQDLHLLKYIDLVIKDYSNLFSYLVSNYKNNNFCKINMSIGKYKFIDCMYNKCIIPNILRFSFIESNIDI